MISIIIPARNESSVIARTLTALTEGAASNESDVIVVCNGCDDDTAKIARSFGSPVRVIETATGSKTLALNLGDQAARTFPRIYMDADVVVPIATIRALRERLGRGDVLAVAPTPKFELRDCSWAVRAFHHIRSKLPSSKDGIGGSGVYALSEAGRRRFGEFPNLTADDGYVRIQFKPEERETLSNAVSIVFPPHTIKRLIVIKARAHYGTFELARLYPELWKRNRTESNHKTLLGLLKFPSLWPSLFVYGFVMFVARRQAKNALSTNGFVWERDHTSRQSMVGTSDLTTRYLP